MKDNWRSMKYIKGNLPSYSVWSNYKFWEDSKLNSFLVKSELTVSQKSREHLTTEQALRITK